jgi:hypothetical protein
MFKDLFSHWHEIVAAIIGIYEVIVRAIPTVGNLSIIGKLIAILRFIVENIGNLSDYLNVTKKK